MSRTIQPAAEGLADLTREELFKVCDALQADLTAALTEIASLRASQSEFDRKVAAKVSELGISPVALGGDPHTGAKPSWTERARMAR